MRSSISSSDSAANRLPQLPWVLVLGGALALAVAFVGWMEVTLAMRGFRPTIVDTQGTWNKQRDRAAELGSHALILVGDSRMQTDLDMNVLRSQSGLEPVQLAIEGSSFVPILEGLARDTRVTGTVLVGYADNKLMRWNFMTPSARYEHDYESESGRHSLLPDFHSIEDQLASNWRASLTSYADGASPLTSLLTRILGNAPVRQYIQTLPDRSRLVDYSQANLHSLNYRHAIAEIDDVIPGAQANLARSEEALRDRIGTLLPEDTVDFSIRSAQIEASVQAIERRGGRVIFVVLPVGGFLPAIDARMFPRILFWDRFRQHSSAQCVHTGDYRQLSRFLPADGLHLDQNTRTPFTRALIGVLGLKKGEKSGK